MTITKDMKIAEIIRLKREAIPVFAQFGLGCVGCQIANTETVEEAALHHGLNLDDFMNALNNA